MDKKLVLFPVLLAFGCLVAGGYGAIHNQISYTVSPDYFHAFKFHQFAIPDDQRSRLGASLVGWQASWWMGLIIGVPVLLVGLVMPDWKTYLTRSLFAYVIVAATALAVGLGSLAWASRAITATALPEYMDYPEGVADRVAFARAGTMHNFSYLGGFLGILTAHAYLLVERFRLSQSHPEFETAPGFIRATVAFVLIAIVPLVVASIGLAAKQWILSINNSTGDIFLLAASLAPGLYGFSHLPISRDVAICLAIAYVPVMSFVLFIYSLCFLGLVFGQYL